ncbi:Uma2 family endonuclease [Streptomyces sp. NPDC021100]|uniref:Uma2 family endonuclease n=1 Tax=Streptomyces sp. NPDC021100 TaxID=3365114 RepID=UPI0037B4BEEF
MADVADSAELDEMFSLVEAMKVPPGYRAEIIEGQIVLNPHRKAQSTIIRRLVGDLTSALGRDADILWDVRVDFPGGLNGYAPDVALMRDGAEEDDHGLHDYRDIEFVAEVVSQGSRRDDYDAKLKVYAAAGIPTYLIADPKTGVAHVFHAPREGVYTDETSHTFGEKFALPGSGIVIDTTSWPRD